jgi:hypothetical protein
MRGLTGLLILFFTLPGASVASDVAPPSGPSLVLETGEALNRVWVEVAAPDGTIAKTLLRETTASITLGETGLDPTGRAAFARWTEAGTETWFSFSRDEGNSWSRGRPLETRLRLRDGTTAPGASLPPAAAGLSSPSGSRVFLVQFKSISLPEFRAAIEEMGAKLLSYFPHNGHLVRIDRSLVASLGALDFVERVEPFHPSYRLEPALRDWLGSEQADPGDLRVRVMAFEWGPAGKARIAEAAESLGARVAEYWPSGHVLELWTDREQLRRIAALDDVAWIDRWSPPEDDMDLVREDAGTNWIENDSGYCGQGVRGEVMDSGVESGHPDFDGIMHHGSYSTSSHGTSTYGIVFGNGDRDGDGQAKGTGHMPCAEQGIFADYDYLGDRFAHTQELKESPYFASFQTNSWGDARTTLYTSASHEMDDIIWRLDIAITQSQSNAGTRASRPQAWAKNIISVGGIYHYDTLSTADDAWNFGASIGPAEDGRIKPDLSYWYDSIYTTTTGSGYTSGFGGTSAATPEVAGVLGLMVQMWSENVWGTNPDGGTVFERQPHFSTIKALLVNNANQYDFTGTSHDLTRVHQGWGRPSAQLAKERAARSFVIDEQEVLAVGEIATFPVTVLEGESELKVTMVYPDPPGTTSSSLHRINDVNLKVISPTGTEYHGNVGLDAGNYSQPGGSPNGVDTVENVFVLDPESGLWNIQIEAAEINQDAYLDTPADDVAFALVVTGGAQTGTCGNGVQEFGEDCDGSDLGGTDCYDLGCTGGGTLGCAPNCTFDTVSCAGCPECGDVVCDFGEDCFSCPGDCISESNFACGNGVCETADGETCLSCPEDCNGVQTGKLASRYCCGDGNTGRNPVTCADSRCTGGGNTCADLPSVAYCCGDRTCEGAEDTGVCAIDCATPGETGSPANGMLLVTGYDRTLDLLSVSYGSGCLVTGNVVEYGELTRANLETYAWSGQECGVGNSGSFDWAMGGLPDSVFFVIVGNNGSSSGSYGIDGNGQERPEDLSGLDCPMPQDLTARCD